MAAAKQRITKSKKPGRGGRRPGTGRPINAALPALVAAQQLVARSGRHLAVPTATNALRDGLMRAAGHSTVAVDVAEQIAARVFQSAYRVSTQKKQALLAPRTDGGFTMTSASRRPPPPCRCPPISAPHQHCAIAGCKSIGVAIAVDRWHIEDRVWGYPEPKTWHCEEHLYVEKQCVHCAATVWTERSQRIVRCSGCEQKGRAGVQLRMPPGK